MADLLAQRRGAFRSGERLCRRLGLSRSAVWKAVRELGKEGYAITASRRLGYRLNAEPDVPLPRLVRRGLETRCVGHEIRAFRTAVSTNDAGLWLAAHGCPDGTVVVAETQTGGRGRLGRRWHSPPGAGLWVSVVLRPALSLAGAQALTFLGAVAGARAIREVAGLPVVLKWPNDLMFGGRKVGGVLTEVSAEADLIRHAVIGIGLNVNLPRAKFPPSLRESAGSLSAAAGRAVPRLPLLRRLLTELDARYALLRRPGGAAKLVAEWRGLTPMVGAIVRVVHLGSVREGTVVGVDTDGALLLRAPAGTVERLLAGDVSIL